MAFVNNKGCDLANNYFLDLDSSMQQIVIQRACGGPFSPRLDHGDHVWINYKERTKSTDAMFGPGVTTRRVHLGPFFIVDPISYFLFLRFRE